LPSDILQGNSLHKAITPSWSNNSKVTATSVPVVSNFASYIESTLLCIFKTASQGNLWN
jgi:hypothetical protein